MTAGWCLCTECTEQHRMWCRECRVAQNVRSTEVIKQHRSTKAACRAQHTMAQARTVSVNVELSKKLTMDLTSRSTASRTAPSISPRRIFTSVAASRSFACTSTGASISSFHGPRSWRGSVKPMRWRTGGFAPADAAVVCSASGATCRFKRSVRASCAVLFVGRLCRYRPPLLQ